MAELPPMCYTVTNRTMKQPGWVSMIRSKQDLKEYMEADKFALARSGRRPSPFDLVWRYERLMRRCEYWLNCRRGPVGRLVALFYRWRFFRLGIKCGFEFPLNSCGKGLSIAHVGPILLNGSAKLGEYCRIHLFVSVATTAGQNNAAPIIGDRVYIGPGARLFGSIHIANDIAVGANAVVNKSFDTPGISIGGIPAKRISGKGSQGLLFAPPPSPD